MSGSGCTDFSPTCTIDDSFYAYIPSLAANAAFVGIFGLTLAIHLVQGIWFRKAWLGFAIAMFLGNIAELIGYVGRIMNHKNPFDQNGFLIQICCITIAPAFFSAAVYFCLGTIVRICDPSISRIPPRFYAYIFIPCDFISLVLQAIGGAMASTATTEMKNPNQGDNTMLAGVSFQVFTLSIFMLLSADYALRLRRSKRVGEEQKEVMRLASEKFLRGAVKLNKKLRLDKWNTVNTAVVDSRGVDREHWSNREKQLFHAFLWALSISTIAIFIRCVYRVVEMSYGWSGVVIANQKLFIGFEGVCITTAILTLNVFHPGFCLKKPGINEHEIIPDYEVERPSDRILHHSTESIDTVDEAKRKQNRFTRRRSSTGGTRMNGLLVPSVSDEAAPYEEKDEQIDEEALRRPVSLADILKESRLDSMGGSTASAEGWLGQNFRDRITRDSKERVREEEEEGLRGIGDVMGKKSSLGSVVSSEDLMGDAEEEEDGYRGVSSYQMRPRVVQSVMPTLPTT